MAWFGPAGDCGCCAGCSFTELHYDNAWTGWTNPPASSANGTIVAGHNTNISSANADGNWIVDIEVADANDSFDTTFEIDSGALVEIFDDSGTTKIRYGGCEVVTMPVSDSFWIRVREATFPAADPDHNDAGPVASGEHRDQNVEIWDGEPDVGTMLGSRYLRRVPVSPTRTAVRMWFRVGDTDIRVGSVKVSQTEIENADCPEVFHTAEDELCVTTPVNGYVLKNCRITYENVVDDSASHEHIGNRATLAQLGGIPAALHACSGVKEIALDNSELNGSYDCDLGEYVSGIFQNVIAEPDASYIVDALARGVTFCGRTYKWRAPRIDLSAIVTITETDTGCAFNAAEQRDGADGLLDGTDDWTVGTARPACTTIVPLASQETFCYKPGTALALIWTTDNFGVQSGTDVATGYQIGSAMPVEIDVVTCAPNQHHRVFSHDALVNDSNLGTTTLAAAPNPPFWDETGTDDEYIKNHSSVYELKYYDYTAVEIYTV